MKDAFGHGSNSQRIDLGRNKIGMATSARFSGRVVGPPVTDAQKHLADLRDRLRTPSSGQAFLQGIKRIFS